MKALLWLGDDLRIDDNPALNHALDAESCVAIYIHDNDQDWPITGAAAWWLDNSLQQHKQALEKQGITLVQLTGETLKCFESLHRSYAFDTIFTCRAYSPAARKMQKHVHSWATGQGLSFNRFTGSLLFEPEHIRTQKGDPFRVFTPFYRNCRTQSFRPPAVATKTSKTAMKVTTPKTLRYAYQSQNWQKSIAAHWQPGETSAHRALHIAIAQVVEHYAETRDQPALLTSRLSPYLRFGELSPARVWHEIATTLPPDKAEPFLRQLIWREFNYHLLYHFPQISDKNFSEKFDAFPWKVNQSDLNAWQKGQTGYPMVDAAMRELWQTGWMHNRARMIVASFLTKHLLIPWQEGARWFWDTLVDADLANNTNGWQWTAGSGADAAPYFRIFNPITQGSKFDPNAEYIRRWVPELSKLPERYIFQPDAAPAEVLANAEITLGEHYPRPIVEHKSARERALAAYQKIKS
jgi:deoxyribodipyrimidine photo-lyase